MDRQIPVGNRLVHQKMQEFRTRKHRQTLSMIKSRGSSIFNQTMYTQQSPKHNRYSSGYLQNKNLQIERQNIKLFNKIASIIREKPKITETVSYAHSSKAANERHRKRQERIKTQNQIYQKRLSQQKPTIQNKQFYKDRMKNLKYLKMMGRFPYEKGHKSVSSHQVYNSNFPSIRGQNQQLLSTDTQIYRKKIDQFFVKITRMPNSSYVFSVQVDNSKKVFEMTMKKNIYEDQFMKCGYNYQKLIGRLRLNDHHQVIFDQIKDGQEQLRESQFEK